MPFPFILPEDGYDTFLATGIGKTDTEIPVNELPNVSEGFLAIFEEDGTTIREVIYFGSTDSASSELRTVTRGLKFRPEGSTYDTTSDTDFRKDHPGGRRIAMTTTVFYVGMLIAALNGDEQLQGIPLNPASRTISNSRHLVDKEYADLVGATAGGITAFAVTDNGGITINVGAGRWMFNDTVQTYAGASNQSLTDDATNYVQLKFDGTLVINTSGFLTSHLPLAEVVAASGDITGITDRRPWLTLAQLNELISTSFTYGETISALDPVYVDAADSNQLKKADATAAATADVIGIARDAGVDEDTDKSVYLPGSVITGVSGLTPNAYVYLDDSGGFSPSQGTYRKVVGWAISATAFVFMADFDIERIAGASSDVTKENFNAVMEAAELLPYGDGSDGALSVTSGTTTLDASGARVLVKQYTSIDIQAGTTLTISNPHASGTILILKSQGDVDIAGTIDLDGMGAVGGASDHDAGDDATGAIEPGAAGGQGSDDSTTRLGGAAGTVHDLTKITYGGKYKLQPGSGGGSSLGSGDSTRGDGGRGGGALLIVCAGAYNFTGTITADGGNGTDGGDNTGSNSQTSGGGGGGGGGAAIVLYRTLTADSGTYSLDGGNGGDGGDGSAGTSGGLGSGGGGGGSNRVAGGDGGDTPSGSSQDGVSGASGTNDDGTGGAGGSGGTASAKSAGSGGGGGAGGYKIVGTIV